MQEFETGAVRQTGGKGRMDLIPWESVIRISKHMEDALTHYPERNWEKGMPMHVMIDSAFRHLAKYAMGMDDEDHLCAAATNLLMAMWTEEHFPELRDIGPAVKRRGTIEIGSGTSQTCRYYDPEISSCLAQKYAPQVDCHGVQEKCEIEE